MRPAMTQHYGHTVCFVKLIGRRSVCTCGWALVYVSWWLSFPALLPTHSMRFRSLVSSRRRPGRPHDCPTAGLSHRPNRSNSGADGM